jgi:hypothetical protein
MNDQTYSGLRSKRCVCQTDYMFCKKNKRKDISSVSLGQQFSKFTKFCAGECVWW